MGQFFHEEIESGPGGHAMQTAILCLFWLICGFVGWWLGYNLSWTHSDRSVASHRQTATVSATPELSEDSVQSLRSRITDLEIKVEQLERDRLLKSLSGR